MSVIDSSINGTSISTSNLIKDSQDTLKTLSMVEEQDKLIKDEKNSEKISMKKGDIILTSVPFAYILKSSLRGLHCDNCLRKKPALQRCSSCACSYYCNIDCQKTSWKLHKTECKKLKRLKPKLLPDTAALIARVIFRLQEDGQEAEEEISGNRSRKFKDLVNHYIDIKEDPKKLEHFEATLGVLKSFLGDDNLPNEEELLEIFGRVYVNSFTITDKDLNAVGLGVYLAGSIFNHSCKPNVYASFHHTKLVVRALYDFPEFNINEMRISYIDVLNTREKRINDLQDGYFFTCDCTLCQDKARDKITFSINCGNPNCHHPVYVGDEEKSPIEPCKKCSFKDFPRGTKEKYLEIVSLTKEKLDEPKADNYLDVAKFLLNEQGSLLHKYNIWKVRTLDAAFESAIGMTVWDDAVSYGNLNLEGLRYYYGANHPMYGLSLLKLAKIELYMFKLEEAFNHLCLAEPILLVSLGRENPTYYEDLNPLMKQVKQEIGMMQNSGFNVLKNK